MTYEKSLIDRRGRTFPRKNEYIIDLIEAKEKATSPKYSKADHPYNKKLKKYEDEKKSLLEKANSEANSDPNTPEDKKRSEEHTSELQSRFDLVCRLLLEKKKKNT